MKNIITGKDVNYFKDFFKINYLALKECKNMGNLTQDEELKRFINECSNEFYDVCVDIVGNLRDEVNYE